MHTIILGYTSSKYPFDFLIKKKYQHVDYFIYNDPNEVIYILVGKHYIYVKEISHEKMQKILLTKYSVVDIVERDRAKEKFLPHFKFYSCVTIGKKLLGLTDYLLLSPFQLHKRIVNYQSDKFKFIETFTFWR